MKLNVYPPYDYSYLSRSDLHDFLRLNLIDINVSKDRNYIDNGVGCFGTLADCKKFIDENSLRGGVFLVYCYEPRFDLNLIDFVSYEGCEIHIMNVYTNDVYLNIFHDFRPDHIVDFDSYCTNLKEKGRNFSNEISQLASFHQWMIDQNFEHDLIKHRNEIAIAGSEYPFFSLHGRSWPDSIKVKGDSRGGDWVGDKKDILKLSFFNISLENTLAPNYVTEKIWDSIVHLNFPVYWGNSWLNSFLDSDCYIDYSTMRDPAVLIQKIQSMNYAEWFERMVHAGRIVSGINMELINKSKLERFSALLGKLKGI